MKRCRKYKKRQESYLGIALLMLIGFGVLLYPHASNLWTEYLNSQSAQKYTEKVEILSEDEREEIYQEAILYNREHQQNTIVYDILDDPVPHQEYQKLLNVKDDIMGTLLIPKIKQKLVIYHGLADETLEKGCGHVEGTSLPVGGTSTHGAYAAHRGLPDAKLFTDLDQLEEGDLFYFYVLGEYLAYEVDQIKVVLPKEVDDIQIEDGKDLATLITCTPYAVNSHRLLVRGHRVPYVHQEVQVDNNHTLHTKLLFASVIGLVLVMIFVLLFVRK